MRTVYSAPVLSDVILYMSVFVGYPLTPITVCMSVSLGRLKIQDPKMADQKITAEENA